MVATIGIAIPVRNEAEGIGRCLEGLLGQRFCGRIRIAVVANGCSDATERNARDFEPRFLRREGVELRVLSTTVASKPVALNLAQEALEECRHYAFLDADVELSPNALAEVVRALDRPTPLIAQPSRIVAPGARGVGRIFAAALLGQPWIAGDILTGGFYAVNGEGRRRWSRFPPIAADDAFVFSQFAPGERLVLRECTATHPFPNRLFALLRQQRRWQLAARELSRSGMAGSHAAAWSLGRRLRCAARRPKRGAAVGLVQSVRLLARFMPDVESGSAWMPDGASERGV